MAQSKKDNPNSKYWKKKADDAWSDEIRKVGCCEYCGGTKTLNAHHLIGRTNLRYRHDLSNGVCLCVKHHRLGCFEDVCAHGDLRQVENFKEWIKESRPGQYQWYEEHKDDKRQKEKTYQECYEELKG